MRVASTASLRGLMAAAAMTEGELPYDRRKHRTQPVPYLVQRWGNVVFVVAQILFWVAVGLRCRVRGARVQASRRPQDRHRPSGRIRLAAPADQPSRSTSSSSRTGGLRPAFDHLEVPMQFPTYRPRRLRRTETLRAMVRETTLDANDLIYPLFVEFGDGRPSRGLLDAGRLQHLARPASRRDRRAQGARHPGGHPLRHSGDEGRGGQRRICRGRHRAAGDPHDQGARSRVLRHHRRLHVRVHLARPLRRARRPAAAS